MKKNDSIKTFVAEEILEVRFTPRAAFITHSGEIADYISDSKLFPIWEIDGSVIKFKDQPNSPKNLHAFMSYKNLGIVAIDAPTENFFPDKASKYWKTVSENKLFEIPTIQRIGVRQRIFVRLDIAFEEIENKMFDYLCKSDVTSILGGKRNDFQFVIDTKVNRNKLRAIFGPITKGQAKELFNFQSQNFDYAGAFFDFDFSIEDNDCTQKQVEEFIRSTPQKNWTSVHSLLEKMGL